jgi:hypothetical protein
VFARSGASTTSVVRRMRWVTAAAAASTASDFVAYASGAQAAAGTLTSTGLVTGPIFGPPSGDEPACSVLFAWFELGRS